MTQFIIILIICIICIILFLVVWRETYIKNIDKSKLTVIEYETIDSTFYRVYYKNIALYYKPKDSHDIKEELVNHKYFYKAKDTYKQILNDKFRIKRKGKLIPVLLKIDMRKTCWLKN